MNRFIELTLDTGELIELDRDLLSRIEELAPDVVVIDDGQTEFTFHHMLHNFIGEIVAKLINLDLNFFLCHVTDGEGPILGSQGTCGCPDGEEGDEGIPEIPYDE